MPCAAVPVLAHRQLAGLRAPAARVDGRVLEQQQHAGQLPGLHPRADALLQRHPLAVLDLAEVADEQVARLQRSADRGPWSRAESGVAGWFGCHGSRSVAPSANQ